MAKFELITFPSDLALAEAVAKNWLDTVEAANRTGTPQFVALSGGRIARGFFIAVAELARSRKVSFTPVHFFWADERCVPLTDPESNFALAHQHLLQPLAIAPDNIHRVAGELEPIEAAKAAAAELSRVGPRNPDGQPVLDLVFLGMGEDGHVASIFPGEAETWVKDRAIYRAVSASKPPPSRITLGYGVLATARQVWVLASGAGKEAALRESLAVSGKTPLGRLLGLRSQTRIFTDIIVQT